MNNPEGGIPIIDPGNQNPDPGQPQRKNSVTDQWNTLLKNQHVQQAKQVSKQYSGFFLSSLAHPYRTMKSVEAAQALHGIITMILMAILSSFYFLTWFIKWDISPAFGPGFLKPLLLTAVGIAVAFCLMYALLRIEKLDVNPKLLAARFGTLLVPTVAVLLLAILFLICNLSSFALYLLILSYLILFVALNSVLFQYPLNRSESRIDTTYTLVIANAVTGYIFYKLITSVIIGAISGIFGGFSAFD